MQSEMNMSNIKMRLFSAALCVLVLVVIRSSYAEPPISVADEVRAAETAFAKSMADRDFVAFAAHVADDAIFFGRNGPLTGKAAVLEAWKSTYEGPKAPFSWKPEVVVALASGTLAHSSGPVLDADGNRVGTFNSVWRRDFDGQWRVVFDKGCDVCNCKPAI
jgi:ketosteroid isomerase-like protein